MLLSACFAIALAQDTIEPWKTIPLSGGYSVDSPVALKKVNRSASGALPPNSSIWLTPYKGAAYLVAISLEKLKKDTTPDTLLEGFLQGYLAETGGVIRGERDILFRGWPGVEIEWTSPDGAQGKFRTYAVRETLFTAGLICLGKTLPSDTEQFIGSMVIPMKLGQGPQKKAGPEFDVYPLAGAQISVRMPSKPERSETTLPNGTSKIIGFRSAYVSRTYFCAYLDLPDEAADGIEEHELELFEKMNDDSIRAFSATGRRDTNYLVDKRNVLSTSAKVERGFSIRIDTFRRGLRVYSLVAVVPQVMLTSEEVKAFFASAKLD